MEVLDGSRNLTQQLAYELGKAIVQGKYRVDAPFPTEAELSAQHSISRSVTREAVKMLTAKGLICSRPRKGIRVQPMAQWNMFDSDVLNWILAAKPSWQLFKEFTQLRAAIEPEAVALASLGASAEQLRALEQAVQRLEAAERGEGEQLAADIDFHICLLEASNNRFFVQFSGFIQAALRLGLACTSQLKPSKARRTNSQKTIYKHIAAGNAQQGRDCMRKFLDDTLRLINDSVADAEAGVSVKKRITV